MNRIPLILSFSYTISKNTFYLLLLFYYFLYSNIVSNFEENFHWYFKFNTTRSPWFSTQNPALCPVPCAWTYLRPLFHRLAYPRDRQQAGREAWVMELPTIAGNEYARDFAISFTVSVFPISNLIFRKLFPFYKWRPWDSERETVCLPTSTSQMMELSSKPRSAWLTHRALTHHTLLPLLT